jgi:hypothetical protein
LSHEHHPVAGLVFNAVGLERCLCLLDLGTSSTHDLEHGRGAADVGLVAGDYIGERGLAFSRSDGAAAKFYKVTDQLSSLSRCEIDHRVRRDHLIVDDIANAPPTSGPRIRVIDSALRLTIELVRLLEDW